MDDLNLLKAKMLLQEAEFYQIETLANLLRRSIRLKQTRVKRETTNEKECVTFMCVVLCVCVCVSVYVCLCVA